MSPLPSSCSAPGMSRMTRESTAEATLKAMRAGKLALIRPVTTSTLGRWVAMIRWMPVARAIWAMRHRDFSVSCGASIIRSASSSITITTNGSRSSALASSL